MEQWDIYDENKQKTGRTMNRNDWNMQPGDFHLTVLGVLRRPDGTYLLDAVIVQEYTLFSVFLNLFQRCKCIFHDFPFLCMYSRIRNIHGIAEDVNKIVVFLFRIYSLVRENIAAVCVGNIHASFF